MKKISVAMITYNHEKYIEKAVESVLMQKGNFKLELLIGNDKSPDRTAEILKKYENDSRVKIFNRKKNMGATKNGLDIKLKCTGDYIAVLEGDDYWVTDDKLAKQLKILETRSDAILCYADSYTVDENNKIIGQKLVKRNCIENFDSLMANRGEIPTGTIMYKNIFKDKKNIDNLKKLLTSSEMIGDLSSFAAFIKEGKFYRLNEFAGAYRYITNSTSYSSRSNLYKEKELYKVFKGISEYYNLSGVKKYLFLERRRNRVLKEIKKENQSVEDILGKLKLIDKIKIFIYKIIKPFDDLKESLNKKKYRA